MKAGSKNKVSAHVRKVPKAVGRPKKVGVAKGFGPRHSENAKEGEEVSTDTVPAMLTPREAVLNRNAAELAGRGNIEKLNTEGNKLAKKGVDLAAEGDADVPEYLALPDLADLARGQTEEDRERLFEYLEEALRRRGTLPVRQSEGDFDPRAVPIVPAPGAGQRMFDPRYSSQDRYTLAQKGNEDVRIKLQKGESDMKEQKVKLQGGADDVRRKRPVDSIGSGYGTVPGPNADVPGTQNLNQYGVAYGWNPGGGVLGHPGGGVLGHPQGQLGGMPTGVGSPFWQRTHPGYGGGGDAGGGAYPMPLATGPVGNWVPPVKRMPSNNFYPPGQGMQYGESEVQEGIGKNFGPAPDLSAPDISKLIEAMTKEAKSQGLNATQISSLLKAFQGMGGGGQPYDQLGGSGASFNISGGGNPTMTGYQGGISDIGYPPGIAPRAQFHYDKGGWIGPYDPNYMIPTY